MKALQDYFQDKNFLIQPTGFQGALYKVGVWTELYGSTGLIVQTLSRVRLFGAKWLIILKSQPFLVVAVPTVGSIFFHGCGTLFGNNLVGRSFMTAGNILSLTMRGIEIMFNAYTAPTIGYFTGIKLHENATQTISKGPGLTKEQLSQLVGTKTPVPNLVKSGWNSVYY